ncbi:type II toxin-antitoxin system RelE/ParE family toxin [Streptomyces sp. NPDC051569]|uniref:type II toxin-antitoxin system RelE/ParE family toxin n=1 Tax=Streptomyces sp. NPDC051569 TaxID=3365661 RepID=UPI0037B6A940
MLRLLCQPALANTPPGASRPGRRRLRVGDHRVACTVDNGEPVVRVVHVGDRSTVQGS